MTRPLHFHKNPIEELKRRYRVYRTHHGLYASSLIPLILFAVSLVVNFFATRYANIQASNYVEDIILSNTPVFDVDWFFVYGLLFLATFITLLCLAHPKRIPFTLYALTLFILIRAVFISLTHLGPFPLQTDGDVNQYLARFFFADDYFFSGHTGAPFLLALIYWKHDYLRYFFIAASLFFGTIVLLGHLHYTIDVAAAFFITYAIYKIAVWIFPKAKELFDSED
ncbi:MAG: phosphatase PAP2-related protein [Patescibacteria group bacterium]